MKFFTDWFKPKDKRNVVVPSVEVAPLRGAELIRAFSTPGEPLAADFPKEKYKSYWETFIDAIPGGYGAIVHIYSYKNGFEQEHRIARQSLPELRQEVTRLILSTMEASKV